MGGQGKKEDSYAHILKYTGLFGGVQGVTILVGLVRNKIVAMLLGPSGMGLASLFQSTVSFLSQSTSFGISFSAVRRVSELADSGSTDELERYVLVVRAWSLLAAVLGFVVCVLAGPLSNKYSFSWGDHTLHFVLLAPAVGLLAITGGETAILKGTRRLKALAACQVYTVLSALAVSIPLYYYFSESAIVPVITLMGLASMLTTVSFSYRYHPLRPRRLLACLWTLLGEGSEIVRLGSAFVLAAIFTSGADMSVRYYLNLNGGLPDVGLYNAGVMIATTAASVVFSSLESDYFPRLSAADRTPATLSLLVNRQIEVTLLVASPIFAALMLSLPLVVPLLFTGEFLPVVPMTQLVLLSQYFRAVYLPLAYVNLARGSSVAFLLLDLAYDVFFVASVVLLYRSHGIVGAGMATALSNVLDLLMVSAYVKLRYGYTMSLRIVLLLLAQLPFALAAIAVTTLLMPSGSAVPGLSPIVWWALGLLAPASSLALSLYMLRRDTSRQ